MLCSVDFGRVLDQFTQETVDTPISFPGQATHGNAALLSRHFPYLREDEITPYLVQKHDWAIPVGANTKVQPGDEYGRFEAGAGLDFIRMLGVQVRIQNNAVQLTSPLYRSLWKTR